MSGAKMTCWFVVAVLVIGIIYDIWICTTKGSASTISWVTWTTARQYPVIPFAVGILCGHLFWVQQTGMMLPKATTATMAKISAIFLGNDNVNK